MRHLNKWLAPITIVVLATLFLLLWENPPIDLMPAGLFGQRSEPAPPTPFATNILINSSHRSYDATGQLKSVTLAKTTRSFQVNPDSRSPNDYTQMEMPDLTLYQTGAPPWKVTAKQAQTARNSNQVELMDEVRLWQIDRLGRSSELETDYLVVKPEQRFAETDKPVTIRSPNETTRATGMRADLEQDRMQLLSDVRGTYEPEK